MQSPTIIAPLDYDRVACNRSVLVPARSNYFHFYRIYLRPHLVCPLNVYRVYLQFARLQCLSFYCQIEATLVVYLHILIWVLNGINENIFYEYSIVLIVKLFANSAFL